MGSNLPEPTPGGAGATGDPSADVSTSRGLTRPALERVLARAAELHVAEGGGEPGDTVSEARLVEIAREVGLSPTAVRQALAEEQTRVAIVDEPGVLGRMLGPGVVSATRLVRGDVASVIAALDAWMQREECMQVQRRFTDRVVWEPRHDWFGAVRRALHVGGRTYQLCSARQVAVTVVTVDAKQVVVRLDADLVESRAARARRSALAGATGVAGAGTVAAIGVAAHVLFPVLLVASAVPLGACLAGAVALARAHARLAERVTLALELVLDRLEHQEARSRGVLRDAIAAARPLLE